MRGIVFFVEGYTEIEFIKALVQCLQQKSTESRRNLKIEYKNAKGIGNYQQKVLRVFKNKIFRENPNITFDVVFCYDTDVFEYSRKPPVDWRTLETELMKEGAHKVVHIRAKYSIEDWFLKDYNGVLEFLRLPKKTSLPDGRGLKKLQSLFKKVNRVYLKGSKVDGFIQKLDMDKIVASLEQELAPLIELLNIPEEE